jgi:hypothetical protein
MLEVNGAWILVHDFVRWRLPPQRPPPLCTTAPPPLARLLGATSARASGGLLVEKHV